MDSKNSVTLLTDLATRQAAWNEVEKGGGEE